MEYKKRCRTCGKVFCYTDADLARNKSNRQAQALAGLSTIANAIGGTMYGAVESDKMADRASSKIVDYDKCPYCGSIDVYLLDDVEIKRLEKEEKARSVNISGGGDPAVLLKRAALFLEDGEWAMADAYAENALNGDPENPFGYLYKLMADKEVNTVDELAFLPEELTDNALYKKVIRFADPDLKEKLEIINKEILYKQSIFRMDKAETEAEYLEAAEHLKGLSYKDSEVLYSKCIGNAEICRKDTIYNSAISRMGDGSVIGYEEAIRQFRTIAGWKDSDEQIYACQRKIEDIKTATKKGKKALAIFAPIIAVLILFVVILTTVIIPNGKYNSAVDLYNSGKYEDAIEAFKALNGYKDSTEKVTEVLVQYMREKTKSTAIGDYIVWGSYEQDNNTTNGKEDIEWQVLEKQNDKILLISRYALDCKPFNTSLESITWENCSLRRWLNDSFINAAFSSEEQNLIINTTVTADMGLSHSTDSPTPVGNNTIDKVFLLSYNEVNKYLSSYSKKQCKATTYAKAQGARVNSNTDNCQWWLRTRGMADYAGAGVYDGGSVYIISSYVNADNYGVRPALWINLE